MLNMLPKLSSSSGSMYTLQTKLIFRRVISQLAMNMIYEFPIQNTALNTFESSNLRSISPIHVVVGISYNDKGVFLFYNDPNEPGPKEYLHKPQKPRKTK